MLLIFFVVAALIMIFTESESEYHLSDFAVLSEIFLTILHILISPVNIHTCRHFKPILVFFLCFVLVFWLILQS